MPDSHCLVVVLLPARPHSVVCCHCVAIGYTWAGFDCKVSIVINSVPQKLHFTKWYCYYYYLMVWLLMRKTVKFECIQIMFIAIKLNPGYKLFCY